MIEKKLISWKGEIMEVFEDGFSVVPDAFKKKSILEDFFSSEVNEICYIKDKIFLTTALYFIKMLRKGSKIQITLKNLEIMTADIFQPRHVILKGVIHAEGQNSLYTKYPNKTKDVFVNAFLYESKTSISSIIHKLTVFDIGEILEIKVEIENA